jgi:hypothetical protein
MDGDGMGMRAGKGKLGKADGGWRIRRRADVSGCSWAGCRDTRGGE